MRRMRSITTALAGALMLVTALPASAAETTEVAVTGAVSSGGSVVLTGTITFGDDATGAISLGDDAQGDATTSGVGLDIGEVTISANPASRRLTYAIEVHDMIPVVNQTSPFFAHVLPISIDGNDTQGWFLAAGNAGANFPPAAGPFWALCTAPAGSYSCPSPLQGTMHAGGITIQLPYSSAGIQPGSLVEPGGALGCGAGVCSTLWAILLFGNLGGDSAFLAGYKVPGQVKVGVAPAGTPPGQVSTTATATVNADGSWNASLPAPAPGEHIVVARSCWGNTEDQRCAEGSATVTI